MALSSSSDSPDIDASSTGLEPAATVIALLGGHSKVAAICGVHRTSVYHWAWPKARRGRGGRIPQNNHLAILRAAREQGIAEITAESLLDRDLSASSTPADGEAAHGPPLRMVT